MGVSSQPSDSAATSERDPASAIVVPPDVFATAVETLGRFFEPISKADPELSAREHLDLQKSIKRAQLLQRYTPMAGKRLLEVGSGFGTNLAVWIKHFDVDGYGVEPGGEGFNSSFEAAKRVFEANGLDSARLVDALGEQLPFEDESFDIVYSAYAIEHTQDPQRVLSEAVRVLKPGGILHFEAPNYLSYFEGHYMCIQPPIVWKPMLSAWVRLVLRRDPAFARTLQTCVNPLWFRGAVRRINRVYPVELLSLGGDEFLERLSQPYKFEMERVASKLELLISLMQRLNVGNWIGRSIVLAQGHYPIYLTLRRKSA